MLTFSIKKLLFIIALAVFGVLTHWGVWENGIYELGWNTSLYWLGIWYLLLRDNRKISIAQDWPWLIPLWLIAFSFLLFENPWLKLISAIILPLLTGAFYSFGQLKNKYNIFWNERLLIFLIERTLVPLACIPVVCRYCKSLLLGMIGEKQKSIGKRILIGVLCLLPLAIFVTILLSSADKNFGVVITSLFTTIFESFNIILIIKLITILLSIIGLLSVNYGWRLPSDYNDKRREWSLDSLVVGIVLVGLLSIYLIFLYLQFEYILIESLPVTFSQAEAMVKSGFWQLFFLSILNALLFFLIYKNTTRIAQIILRVFILASGLLLLSACWRLGLYVYWYGLSYEKFFASYTCIYALCIFVFLLLATFSKVRKNIFFFIAFSSLWFYATATVMPVERIIFNVNHYLAENDGNGIYLNDLTSLSIDVAAPIHSRYGYLTKKDKTWGYWLDYAENECSDRPWYAQSMSFYINCKSFSKL